LLLENACFSFGLPGAALAQLATIVNPASKPTKVKWSLSWSRALENCGKAMKSCSLINNGLYNQGLAPLGKAWSLNLAIAFGKGLLLFWASRSYSGTAGYNSEPSKQTY